jgi:hypothetical protein
VTAALTVSYKFIFSQLLNLVSEGKIPTTEEISLPATFMWKSEKNGLIVRQPEIEKPDRMEMLGEQRNRPLFWTDSLIEFQ